MRSARNSPFERADLTAAEANRRFYAGAAETYDASEQCVVDPRLQLELRATLERACAELPDDPAVLDACGGSGNVSLALLELGVHPVTVDISPEMLAIYERKARCRGHAAETRVSEIESFLREDPRTWDLIVFSSALHHLDDYLTTLALAVDRLTPGGVVLTMFDPTRAGPAVRKLRRFDYVLHVFLNTPERVPRLLARRLRRPGGGSAQRPPVGELAELHALSGIDDVELARSFRAANLDILVHERTYEGRFAVTRALCRLFGAASSFRFLVQKPR